MYFLLFSQQFIPTSFIALSGLTVQYRSNENEYNYFIPHFSGEALDRSSTIVMRKALFYFVSLHTTFSLEKFAYFL